MNQELLAKLKNLPSQPGVYQFKNTAGKIIYVGKAKNLKNRISSYFQKSASLTPDKQLMVVRTADLEYILTSSEIEAILLEANLIKEHHPRFNIVMRDDKNFLYIKITSEDFPQILTTRRFLPDKNRYFGPYASAGSAKHTLWLLRKLFPFRNCSREIRENNRPASPKRERGEPVGRACLEFDLGRCLGPCQPAVVKKNYQEVISQVIKFLKGQGDEILKDLKIKMKKASATQAYETAGRLRDQIQAIEEVITKQKIVGPKKENQDIISLVTETDLAGVNLFQIRQGKLIAKQNFLMENIADRPQETILNSFLVQYYSQTTDFPKEIILPSKIASGFLKKLTGTKFTYPRRGKKWQLIKLGETNAFAYLNQQKLFKITQEKRAKIGLAELFTNLKLPKPAARIEAYDISNLQGLKAVGSMVVFADGQPKKSDYRKFKIKTVRGANDPAMMAEVIKRRLARQPAAGGWPLPDLIILDGGKGQLSVVKKMMAKQKIKIPVIAIAKRLEEIFLPGQKNPVILPAGSQGLLLLKRIRDEAHRFAINYFRKKYRREVFET